MQITDTMEGLDIAELQVLLIAEELRNLIYILISICYTETPAIDLVLIWQLSKGNWLHISKPAEGMGEDISTYYTELLDTAIRYTLIPEIDIQQAGTILFAEDMISRAPLY